MKNTNFILRFVTFILGLSVNSMLAQVGLGPAPYCFPQYNGTSRPCNQPNASNTVGNTINDFIDSFNTTGASNNIVNNNSGCNSQIFASTSENYFFVACPIYLRVLPGQNITCNFRSGIIYDQGFAVFVDWNQNSVFDLPGERVCAVTGLPTAATWTSAAFVVPGTQAAGTYRMRVRCAYVTTGGLIDPCNLYSFGETEDYRLIVGAGSICSVLPVELTSFDAVYRDNFTELTWSTATENNSDHFIIERSYDNENFELVAKVTSNGNSNSIKHYSATDKNPKRNSIVYYRLKSFDKNNNSEIFSKTITLYTNNTNIGFDVFPNPANTQMTLVLPDLAIGKTVSISVYDNSGKKVLGSEVVITDENTLQYFDINSLEKGTYYIKVTEESGINMSKILIKH